MLKVRKAIMEDAAILAPRLRTADKQEIQAVTGEAPYPALRRSIAQSAPCHAITDERGEVIALFGVVADAGQTGVGCVWLLGSPELILHSTYFLRHSIKWVKHLLTQYKILWNYVDARNEVHIRWLKWCGFVFLCRIEAHGLERRPFYEFERVREEPA